MDTTDVFSTRAKYARYRWDYAPQAVQTVLDETGVCQASFVADIGAGTGILTRHFVGKVGHVFAVEPNAEMRRMAAEALRTHPFESHAVNELHLGQMTGERGEPAGRHA